jgi:hypothetical protein
MRSTFISSLLALVGASMLCACQTKYQCDVYDLDTGARVTTTYLDASSEGEAEDACEEENAPLDCSCYEDT